MSNKKRCLSVGVISFLLLLLLVFCISWFNRKDSICDEYSIYWKNDIASAVLVQNVSGGDVGKLYGSDLVKKEDAHKKFFSVLKNIKKKENMEQTSYSIEGFVLHNPTVECKTKAGKEFIIQWSYPTNLIEIDGKKFFINEKDAQQLYVLFQAYHPYKAGGVQ